MRTISPLLCPALAALAIATTAAGPRAAHAGDDRDELLVELNLFVTATEYAVEDGVEAASYFARPAAECDAVVARLAKAGMKPDDLVDGRAPYRFRQAPERCRSYARWQTTLAAAGVVAEAAADLAITRSLVAGQDSEQYATDFGARAAACTAAVDRALAAGAPPTLAVRVRSNLGDAALTLPAARAEICLKLADWAATFGPATLAAKKAAAEAARARYASVGAAGDRLSWLTYYDPDGRGAVWFVPGCKSVDDPKKLAKAAVLIRWTEADDGTQTLRRLQFKGNKLVKDTTRSFRTEGAARAGCK